MYKCINVFFFNLIQNVKQNMVMSSINHVLVEPQHQKDVIVNIVLWLTVTTGGTKGTETECYLITKI